MFLLFSRPVNINALLCLFRRYGYINFGMFKIISPPLSRASSGGATTDKIRRTASTSSVVVTGRRGTTVSPEKMSSSLEKKASIKVIVIGAGAAGLAAARQLTYFGAKVTVLESRVNLNAC